MTALSMNTADSGTCDRPIDPTNQNQYIVWGIGSLGATAFQHHTRATGMIDYRLSAYTMIITYSHDYCFTQ